MDEILNSGMFASIKDKARKLIHQDAQQDAHIIKERIADRKKIVNKTARNDEFDSLMPSYTETPTQINENINVDGEEKMYGELDNRMTALREQVSKQKTTRQLPSGRFLPKEILESFGKLDSNGKYIEENETPIIQESVPVVRNETIPQNNSSNIDYSLIKTIVESSMKKFLNTFSKKMLNESKVNENNNELKAIKLGDKFSFITSNGDIYEAKLVFKKNINQKQ